MNCVRAVFHMSFIGVRIAVGDEPEILSASPNRAKGGRKGGKARAKALTPQQNVRRQINMDFVLPD
jgi:hypothetical protein